MPDIKEHGFIFQPESIRAILARLKTQTRRVVTAHNSLIDGTGEGIRAHWKHLQWDRAWVDNGPSPAGNPGPYWKVPCRCYGSAEHLEVVHRVYPRVQVGDVIYAKETWRFLGTDMLKLGRTHSIQTGVIDYKAGPDVPYKRRIERPWQDIENLMATKHGQGWRSPLHMPRWASRVVLPVIGVKAERIQDISAGDAEAEGVERLCVEGTMARAAHALRAFSNLWQSINGQKSGCAWNDNPPTWCYQWEPMS